MAKDPAFLFYSSDFLTGTITWSDDQVGKYIRLMCLQHQKGELTEKELLKISDGDEDVMAKFEIQPNGKFLNARLKKEIDLRKEHGEKQKKRIQDYWDKKKGEKEQTGNTTVFPLEDVIEIENEDVIEIELGGVGEKPLEMILRIWGESGFHFSDKDKTQVRKVAEKITGEKDIGRLPPDKTTELETVFRKIIQFLKTGNNAQFYGSFESINKHFDKIINGIKNGKSVNNSESELLRSANEVLSSQGFKN